METKQAQTTHKHTGQDSHGLHRALLGSIPCELVRASTSPRQPSVSNIVGAGISPRPMLRLRLQYDGREERYLGYRRYAVGAGGWTRDCPPAIQGDE
jgi:hypothetical protein